MPTMTQLTLGDVREMVLEILNLSKNVAYGTFDNSPLYKTEIIRDHIFLADDAVVSAVLASVGHPRRMEYTYTLNIAPEGTMHILNGSGALFAANRGVVNVEITRFDLSLVPGIPAPAEKIAEWVRNKSTYGGSDCTDGYYNLNDNQLIFSGGACNITFLNTTPHIDADTFLYSPPEYKHAVVRMAVAELFRKDPAKRDLAAQYASEITNDLQLIAAGSAFVPPITQYQKER